MNDTTLKLFKMHIQDKRYYEHFYEICHYNNFGFIFKMWDVIFDGSIPLDCWYSYVKED